MNDAEYGDDDETLPNFQLPVSLPPMRDPFDTLTEEEFTEELTPTVRMPLADITRLQGKCLQPGVGSR